MRDAIAQRIYDCCKERLSITRFSIDIGEGNLNGRNSQGPMSKNPTCGVRSERKSRPCDSSTAHRGASLFVVRGMEDFTAFAVTAFKQNNMGLECVASQLQKRAIRCGIAASWESLVGG